jgi:hypothetical protein
MRALVGYIFVVIAVTAAGGIEALGRIQVVARVDTSKDIYVGESFICNIIIDGENKAGEVDITPLREYNPRSAGNRDVSQTSWTFVNGKTSQKVVKRYVMGYSLTAEKAGKIRIPSLTVTIDGTAYKTNSVEVNILEPGTTDKLDLEVKLSEQRCYVGQAIIMTVNFYVSAEVGDFQMNVPVFEREELFYFENPDITDPGARQYRLSAAMKEPVYVSQSRVVRNQRNATLLSFRKVLTPKRAGEIEIGAVSVSADVAVERSRGFFGFQPRYKRFMVSSAPVKLTVLRLPAGEAPEQFYGLVGRYTISASAAPTKVNVGDPITLTIKIGGGRYLKPVQWPALEQISELAANFRIPPQKASPALERGFKVFTQTIRANNDEVTVIPPIPLAFFDPDKGKYVTAKTEPIELEVAPTEVLTGADMVGSDFAPVNKEVEAIKKGLSANYEGYDVLANHGFSPLAAVLSPGYAVIWGLPLAGFLASCIIRLARHTSPERVAMKRRRSAGGRAVKELKKVGAAETGRRDDMLAAVMKQYVGERFDRSAGSLTAEDCREVIVAEVGDVEIGDRYRDIIDRCEARRYASVEADVDAAQVREVVALVRSIEKKSKK